MISISSVATTLKLLIFQRDCVLPSFPFLFHCKNPLSFAVLYKSTMPAKRKNTKKQTNNGKAKQAKQDGQKAISHDIDVPIDEGFKEGKLWAVPYIDCQDGTCNQVAGNSSKAPYILIHLSHRRCQSLHRRQWDHIRRFFKPNKYWWEQQQVLSTPTSVQ